MSNWSHPSVKTILSDNPSDDPIKVIREKAQHLVLDAFDNGWSGPPFSPLKLAKYLDFNLVPNEFIKDARLLIKNSIPTIEYNPNQRKTRINFSLAHEMAHTFFPDWKEEVRNREDKSARVRELEMLCDIGASEILLPYSKFSKDANNSEISMSSLFNLAEKYEASLESVFLRYCEVVQEPCAIVVCSTRSGNLITDYSKSSHSFEYHIPYEYNIPNSSIAYNCLSPGHTDFNKEKWDVFQDNTLKIHAVGLASLKGSTSSRVGVFIKEIDQDFDIHFKNQLKNVYGDATDPRGDGKQVIVQVVNTVGAMGAGFGKSIKNKWPSAEDSLKKLKKDNNNVLELGMCNLVPVDDNISIYQIVAQKGVKSKYKKTLLSYHALSKGLNLLSTHCKQEKASIHMPLIGSGHAGGDWNIIEGIIYDELVNQGLETTLYILPGKGKKADLNQVNMFSG